MGTPDQQLFLLSRVTGENLHGPKSPDQKQQYDVAEALLAHMGLFGWDVGENFDARVGSFRIVAKTDIMGAGIKMFGGGIRLYGAEGSTKPLGYSIIPFSPSAVERVPGIVADAAAKAEPGATGLAAEKRSSTGSAFLDGAVLVDILTTYQRDPNCAFELGQTEDGHVRLALLPEHYDSLHEKVGDDRVVGIEFIPIIEQDGEPSKTNHGIVAFLTLPEPSGPGTAGTFGPQE